MAGSPAGSAPATHRRPSSTTFCAASRANTRLMAASASGVEAQVGLVRQRAAGRRGRPPGQTGRALGIGDQLAQAQQHVLVAGQPADAAGLQHRGQPVERERGDVTADCRAERGRRRGPPTGSTRPSS